MGKTTTVSIDLALKDNLKLQAVVNGVSLADLTNAVLRKALDNTNLIKESIKEVKGELGQHKS
jgi:hypothetical protein